MRRTARWVPLLAQLLAGCAASLPPAPAEPVGSVAGSAGGSGSVLAGVFTAPQAVRGQQAFQASCASCHSVGEFSGPVFQRVWNGRSVGELFDTMSTMMPQNDPGSLSADAYRDILTYFLRQNGYPEGAVELPADPAVLGRVTFQLAR